MKRAFIYTRVSLDPQGLSDAPERQEKACRAHARREGWRVAGVFSDRDISAYKAVKRPEFERMLDALDGGAADVLLVWSIDRLTRQGASGVMQVHDRLKAAGVQLASVQETLDTSNAMGEAMLSLIASLAKAESEKLGVRQRSKNRARVDKGLPHGGRRMFGYGASDPDLKTGQRARVLDPTEAPIARELVAKYLAGESVHALARHLNERGVSTTSGNQWTAPALRKWLASPTLAGLRQYEGKMHRGGWEPLIAEDIWLAVQQRMKESRNWSGARSRGRYLLTGLARCDLCGGRVVVQVRPYANRVTYRYICRKSPGKVNCGGTSALMPAVDEVVIDEAIALLSRGTMPTDDVTSRVEAVEQDLQRDRANLERLVRDHYVNGTVDAESYASARAQLAERIAEAEAALQRLRRVPKRLRLPRGKRALLEWFESASIADKQRAIGVVVEEVRIKAAPSGGGPRFDPSRVVVVPRPH